MLSINTPKDNKRLRKILQAIIPDYMELYEITLDYSKLRELQEIAREYMGLQKITQYYTR